MTSRHDRVFESAPLTSRREALCLASVSVTWFGTYPLTSALAAPMSGGEAPRADTQRASIQHRESNLALQSYDGIAALLMAERAPRCSIGPQHQDALSTAILTNRTDRFGAGSDNRPTGPNEKLAGRGRDPLDTYVTSLAAKLPDDVKISIGGQWGKSIGAPGKTFLFINPTSDYSNKSVGWSCTIGGGPLAYGGFVNLSYMAGRYDFSAGGYLAATTGHSIQLSINLSDLINGKLTFTEAVSSPIASPTKTPGPESVQLSIDIRPGEIFYDVFVNVLGPLSDYRTFQSPLSDW